MRVFPLMPGHLVGLDSPNRFIASRDTHDLYVYRMSTFSFSRGLAIMGWHDIPRTSKEYPAAQLFVFLYQALIRIKVPFYIIAHFVHDDLEIEFGDLPVEYHLVWALPKPSTGLLLGVDTHTALGDDLGSDADSESESEDNLDEARVLAQAPTTDDGPTSEALGAAIAEMLNNPNPFDNAANAPPKKRRKEAEEPIPVHMV